MIFNFITSAKSLLHCKVIVSGSRTQNVESFRGHSSAHQRSTGQAQQEAGKKASSSYPGVLLFLYIFHMHVNKEKWELDHYSYLQDLLTNNFKTSHALEFAREHLQIRFCL